MAYLALAGTLCIMLLGGEQMVGLQADDSWYMWKAWHLARDHAIDDPLFYGHGVTLFGRIWVEMLAAAYTVFGWRLSVGHFLSALCVAGSAAIWYRLAREMGLSASRCAALTALLVTLLPFTRIGLTARPEAFVWFLTSAAILLFDRRWYFVAGVCAGLAIETHQMGIVSLAYIVAWASRFRWGGLPGKKILVTHVSLMSLAGGLAVGVAVWLNFHVAFVSSPMGTAAVANLGQSVTWHTPLVAYFLDNSMLRRLWVGALCLVAIAVYLRARGWRTEPLPLLIAGCIFTTYLLVPNASQYYFTYLFTSVALIFVVAPGSSTRLAVCLATLVVISWVGYLSAIYLGRNYSQEDMERQVAAKLPDRNLAVVVDPALWPLVRDRERVAGVDDLAKFLDQGSPFYLVVPPSWGGEIPASAAVVQAARIDLAPRAQALIYRFPGQARP
jgi:hypothetical protein